MTTFEEIRWFKEIKSIFESLGSYDRATILSRYVDFGFYDCAQLSAKEQSRIIFTELYGPNRKELIKSILHLKKLTGNI